jgi:hypothetical protein
MKLFYAELLKLKNTFALWLTISGSLFVPLILFATYLSDVEAFVPGRGANPWDDYLIRTLNGCCFFSVGFILLIIGLIIHIEQKANAWKHLFTLPLNRGRIYFGKLALIFAMILVFFGLYLVFSILSGVSLGHVAPELGFKNFKVPGLGIFKFLAGFGIAILPMVFLQYWLSFRLKSLITSLGVGLGGLMVGLLLKNWEYIIYLPYAAPFQMLNYMNSDAWASRDFYLPNAIYTVLLVKLSYQDFTQKFCG